MSPRRIATICLCVFATLQAPALRAADGARIELYVPESTPQEWPTEDEALRAGSERGRYLVDKRVDDD